MLQLMILCSVVLSFRQFILESSPSYEGSQVFRIEMNPKIKDIIDEDISIDKWKETNEFVDVLIKERELNKFNQILRETNSKFEIIIENVQLLINQENQQISSQNIASDSFDDFFKSYQTLDNIFEFLQKINTQYSSITELITIGTTYEGREIKGITIRGKALQNSEKPNGVLYHGGQHAREWIGVASVCYLIHELVSNYQKSDKVTNLLDTFHFTIIPVMNPDGYVYTHTKDRMWRKNREPNGKFFGCLGTDTNRNWDAAWSRDGSSSFPCSDAYHGKSPFSTAEAKAVSEYISTSNLIQYIDFHAYSQLWMTPYGYTCNKLPADYDSIYNAGIAATKALKTRYNTNFKVGSICKIIYQASGSSIDWAYEYGGVKYSYGVELRDTGRHGFMLPADQIIPSGIELFDAVMALNEFIIKEEGF